MSRGKTADGKVYLAAEAPGRREDLVCPDDGKPMVLRDSRLGLFYGCSGYPACRTAHGAHPDGAPLGIPANKATREERIRAHALFDRLWKELGFTRWAAYAWLTHRMERPKQVHIGEMDVADCLKVQELCFEKIKRIVEDPRHEERELEDRILRASTMPLLTPKGWTSEEAELRKKLEKVRKRNDERLREAAR